MEATGHQATPTWQFGPFRLLVAEQLLLRDGAPVPLTPKVFDILRVLVENSGHLVDKSDLLKEVWPDSFVEEGNLNRAVSVLRKALGDGNSSPCYIETVPKRGYRFVMPVTVIPGEPDAPPLGPPAAPEARGPDGIAEAEGRAFASAPRLLVIGLIAATALILDADRPRRHADPVIAPAHRQVTFRGREAAPAISPDGRHVAYLSDDGSERRVVVQDLAGAAPLELFRAPEVGRLRWSPDGARLMIMARGGGKDGMFVVPASGGAPHKVAKGPFLATWSPDGHTIVFPRFLVGTLSFVNLQSGERREITLQAGPQWVQDLDWSAANGELLFVTRSDLGGSGVWTTGPDGMAQRLVLEDDREISAAQWAPGGRAIYFLRFENQTHSLYRVQWHGREGPQAVPALVMGGLETDGAFAISADGSRLVYARAPYSSNLWLVDARARQPPALRELTRGTSVVERPSISPDGTSVVFNMGRELVADLFTLALAGGEPVQLTFFSALSLEGVWSPDGLRIAFASTQAEHRGVWLVDAQGGTPRPLWAGEMSDSYDLSWSPGDEILYQSVGNRNYQAIDPHAGTRRPLVSGRQVGWMFSPAISPDGHRIAVAWNRPPNSGLWVIDRRTTSARLVHATRGFPIGWSKDGTSIYVLEGEMGRYRSAPSNLGETLRNVEILRVPLDGGVAERLFTLPFEEIGGVSITADGRRIVCVVYSSRSDVWMVENFDPSRDD